VRVYDVGSYQAGFVPMIVWSILGVLLMSITKETHCRQMVLED